MTQDWPVRPDYDPTWRSFKGNTEFVPPPFALQTEAELQWQSVYQRSDPSEPAAAIPELAELAPPPAAEHRPADPVMPQARRPGITAAPPPLVPDSVPSVRSPQPIFEPAVPPGGPMADYSTLRVAVPIPTTPVEKLAALYPPSEPTDVPPPRPKRPSQHWASRPIGIVSIAVGIVAAGLLFVVVPKMLAGPAPLKTMFTAPMMVLRAVGPGEVASVGVTIGQSVEPSTVLLTIHTDPLSDAAINDLKAQLAQAKLRQAALDDAQQAAAPGSAAARRPKDAAAAEVDRLQKAIANAGGSGPADQPILAGVRGIVWSLDAQAGGHLQAGDPLAQLADCGRAFLVVQGDTASLKAGQTVLIRMPGVRPFHGTVRPSSGVAEPTNTLVIDPTGFSAVAPNACPVGTTAEVQPESRS